MKIRKLRVFCVLIFSIIGFIILFCNAGSLTYCCHFAEDNFSFRDTILNGQTYSVVNLLDAENRYCSNGISLPFKLIKFSVPFNSDDFSLIVSSNATSNIHIDNPILTYYDENKEFIESGLTFDCLDSIIKGSNNEVIAEINNESFAGGFNRIITVAVYPCQYYPETSELTIISDLRVQLEWLDRTSRKHIKELIPNSRKTFEKCISNVKKSVVNPQDVENNLPILPQPKEVSFESEEEYEYIIVTPREYATAFERLAAMRRLKGYSSKIFVLEEILSDSRFANGDEISGFRNNAGKLRAFLTYAWLNYGTRYVLLAGKDGIPVITRKNDFEKNEYHREYYDTDFYYSELNNTWSNFMDAIYSADSVKELNDFDSELCVGRLCCKSIEEIENYTNKIWRYEFEPAQEHLEYLCDAFVEVMWDLKKKYDIFIHPFYKKIFNLTVIREEKGSALPLPEDVLQILNSNNFGYVDFEGHGYPGSVSVSEKFNSSWESQYKRQLFSYGEGQDCLNLWNNKGFPNWTHSLSCSLMPFRNLSNDPYLSEFDKKYTFAESYLMGGDYGGVVFFGNTGGMEMEAGVIAKNHFFSLLKRDRDNIKPTIAGEIFVKNRTFQLEYGNAEHSHYLKYNISGDPLVHIWNDIPLPVGGNYVMDPERTVLPEDMIFANTDINSSSKAVRRFNEGSEIKPIWETENTVQLIYASNFIPLLSDCVFRNITLNCHAYLITGLLTLGGEKPEDKLIFGPDADYTFESHGGIKLTENVEFKEGARVRFGSKEYVDLSNVKIPKNVKLIIESPTVVKSRNTFFDDKADITFIH